MPGTVSQDPDQKFEYPVEVYNEHSAEVIIPTLLQLLSPRSVVDVGCGKGTWLHVLIKHGVSDVLGIDSACPDDYLPSRDKFWRHDLRKPILARRGFDVALCLEVAEHLPHEFAEQVVDSLCSLSPTVVFSAAIPGQGGVGHMNEQWPEYWASKFRTRGYRVYDILRREFWQDERVEWWYRQNLLVFSKSLIEKCSTNSPDPLVHPGCYLEALRRLSVCERELVSLKRLLCSMLEKRGRVLSRVGSLVGRIGSRTARVFRAGRR